MEPLGFLDAHELIPTASRAIGLTTIHLDHRIDFGALFVFDCQLEVECGQEQVIKAFGVLFDSQWGGMGAEVEEGGAGCKLEGGAVVLTWFDWEREGL